MDSAILAPIIGGILIGLGASALMLFNGKIAGVSGIFGGILSPKAGDFAWRAAFIAGIIVGGIALFVVRPDMFGVGVERSLPVILLGGLLVGFGARLGSGCTSGHGVCGIARLGPRSIVATLTFIATGAVAAYVVNHILGGAA
ncbi:MAG: YeeE/YedE family protein [Myxococcota bacterium]